MNKWGTSENRYMNIFLSFSFPQFVLSFIYFELQKRKYMIFRALPIPKYACFVIPVDVHVLVHVRFYHSQLPTPARKGDTLFSQDVRGLGYDYELSVSVIRYSSARLHTA